MKSGMLANGLSETIARDAEEVPKLPTSRNPQSKNVEKGLAPADPRLFCSPLDSFWEGDFSITNSGILVVLTVRLCQPDICHVSPRVIVPI